MSTLSLIFKEIRRRKISFLLGLLAVVTAVALFISFFTAGNASNRETARLMLSMGFNFDRINGDGHVFLGHRGHRGRREIINNQFGEPLIHSALLRTG